MQKTRTSSTVSGNIANSPLLGGGGLLCAGPCRISLSTFAGNSAPSGAGGAIDINTNIGAPSPQLTDVAITGNDASFGGGAYGVSLKNSIVAGNSARSAFQDSESATDNGGNLIGSTTNYGVTINPKLASLGFYGGTTQTMPPLPLSPALCAGTLANLTAVSPNDTDQRGVTHSTAYCTAAQVDAGAVQTSYTGVAFSTQPTNTSVNTAISPAPALTLTENTFAIAGASIPVALSTTGDYAPSGQPTLSGTLTATTTPATFSTLTLNQLAGGLHLITTVPITSTYSLTATSNAFDVTNPNAAGNLYSTVADNVGSRPYPGDTVTFVATVTNLGTQTYLPTFTVTLPAGLSNVSVAGSSGNDSCFVATPTTVTCIPFGAPALNFYTGNTISVTIQATVTATDAVGSTIAVTAHATDINNDAGNTATDTLTVSAITVNTLTDDATGNAANCTGSGACTLRDAVAVANAASGTTAVPIVFASTLSGTQAAPSTITLTNGQLELSHAATITGPGADLLSISGNNASRILQIDPNLNATISGLTFTKGNGSGNTKSGAGGAIYSDGTLVLVDSALSGNTAYTGGGIQVESGSSATLTRVTINGNTASADGGGVYVDNGALTLANSTVIGNTGSDGGGILLYGTLTLNNSTVTANRAAQSSGGGFLLYQGTATATNSIIAGNSANSYADANGNVINNGGNLIGTGFSGTSTYTPAKLAFAPLGYYGGHTLTLPALPGSVALCAGVATAGNGYTLPATDQRSTGFARSSTYGSTTCVDSGAFQSHYSLAFTAPAANATVVSGESFAAAVNLLESGNTLPNVTATTTQNTLSFSPANVGIPSSISGNTSTALTAGAYAFNAVTLVAPVPGYLTSTLPLTGSISISSPLRAIAVNQPTVSPANSAVVPSPASLPIGGTSMVTVSVVDSNTGAAIQGATVTLTSTGAATITGSPATTNASGMATFAVTDSTIQTVTLTAVMG